MDILSNYDIPKTIEEFQLWYVDENLPSYEATRFYIAEDYEGAMAHGIYFNELTGKYIIYKNTDSERFIIFETEDEEAAVKKAFELFLLLYAKREKERENQPKSAGGKEFFEKGAYDNAPLKKRPLSKEEKEEKERESEEKFNFVIWSIILVIILIFFAGGFSFKNFFSIGKLKEGYYRINDSLYYYYEDVGWAKYDGDTKVWFPSDVNFDKKDVSKNFEHGKRYKESNYPLVSEDTRDICLMREPAKEGYYKYRMNVFYKAQTEDSNSWKEWDSLIGAWKDSSTFDVLVYEINAKNYYLSEEWEEGYEFPPTHGKNE